MATTLVILLLFLTISSAFLRKKKSASVISAYSVVIWLFFLYLALPATLIVALNSESYVWIPEYGTDEWISLTALLCIFSLAVFLLAYFFGPTPKSFSEVKPSIHFHRRPRHAAIALIAIGLALKVYVYVASGDTETNLARLSVGVRESLGIELISPMLVALRYLSGVADAAATWLLIFALRERRRTKLYITLFIFVVSFTFIGSGKRLFLLWPLLAALVAYSCYVKKITLSAIPIGIALISTFGFATLAFRIYAPALAVAVDIDLDNVFWAQGSLLKFYFFSLEFASFETLSLVLDQTDQLVDLFGGPLSAFYVTNVEPLLYFIPRALWPGKPEVFLDLSHAYRVFIFGGRLDDGGGVAATILGTAWTIAKLPGLLITVILFARACRAIDNKQPNVRSASLTSVIWYSFALVAVFHVFRQGTFGWTVIILLFQQSGLVLGFLLILWASKIRSTLIPTNK